MLIEVAGVLEILKGTSFCLSLSLFPIPSHALNKKSEDE